MSSFESARSQIFQALTSTTVAAIAQIPQTIWANYHVFYGDSSYIAGRNRGRLPFVEVKRSQANMTHESEPNYGGTQVITFRIEIHTGNVPRNSVLNNELQADQLARAIIQLIRSQSCFRDGEHTIETLVESPFGYSLAIDLTASLSADKDNL